MASYLEIGKNLYNMDNPREVHRMIVFVIRAVLHNNGMHRMMDYFNSNPTLREFILDKGFPLEQITRAFFYKGSTFEERCRLVREHYDFLLNKLRPEAFLNISKFSDQITGESIWEKDFDGSKLQAILAIYPGQRKEGLLALELRLDRKYLYQIMFWFAKDNSGNIAMWIGALQGPNMDEARDVIKKMTKQCHGYRTKNLALYLARMVCQALGVRKIYAVTNDGYYANNHARVDRKLKTSFSDFWAEAEGIACEDSRWYILPVEESRKTMEEVPTRKRAVYRKRFDMLDEIHEEVTQNMRILIK